jgi:sugar lactone lactonase YvrE
VPLGLASDGDTLFVADWATGIVWAVDVRERLPAGVGVSCCLEGIAVDGDRLLVVETDRSSR